MALKYLTIILLFVALNPGVDGTDEEKKLYEHLFAGYHPEIRPVAHPSHVLEIQVEMELLQIKGIDEKNQVMESMVIIEAQWHDDYLNWNSSEYAGITELVVSPKRVWLPDFGIENSADQFYHSSYFTDFRPDLHSTGRTTWAFGGSISTMCDLDMKYFPFDYQICSIKLENWAFSKKTVTLQNASDHVHLDKYHSNGVWELLETHVSVADVYYEIYPGIAYPEVTFELVLKRKSLYYLVNLILPCLFIISIALLVFWLPPDAGEKVSLGVTALLSFSVFQLVINESTPANSDKTPILSTFVVFTMGMSAMSVFTSILVLHLHHKGWHLPVPRWLKVFAFKVVARALCMTEVRAAYKEHMKVGPVSSSTKNGRNPSIPSTARLKVEDLDKSEVAPYYKQPNSMQPKTADIRFPDDAREMKEILEHMRYISKFMQKKEEEDTIIDEWKMVAQVLDRVLFISSFLVSFGVILWLLIQRGTPPSPVSHANHIDFSTDAVTSGITLMDQSGSHH